MFVDWGFSSVRIALMYNCKMNIQQQLASKLAGMSQSPVCTNTLDWDLMRAKKLSHFSRWTWKQLPVSYSAHWTRHIKHLIFYSPIQRSCRMLKCLFYIFNKLYFHWISTNTSQVFNFEQFRTKWRVGTLSTRLWNHYILLMHLNVKVITTIMTELTGQKETDGGFFMSSHNIRFEQYRHNV